MFIQQFASKFDRWRACEQHRDNTANKLLLTTVDMDLLNIGTYTVIRSTGRHIIGML